MSVYGMRYSLLGAAALAAVAPAVASAQLAGPIRVAEQSLGDALRALAAQSGRAILFNGATVEGKRSKPVGGASGVEAALRIMLDGSGLTWQRRPNGALVIVAGSPPRPTRKPAARPAAVVQAQAPDGSDAPDAAEDIVVTGSYARSLSAAAERKRNSSEIIDSLTAEDVGKFPARNLGEALLRVPGVTVDRVTAGAVGQAVYINVRGLPAYFQNVQFNGRDIANNENVQTSVQYGRSFRFDLLPPDIVSAVDLYKTPNASITEGGIAASLDLRTYRPLTLGNVMTASVKATRNDLADRPGGTVTALGSWANAPGTFGIVLAGSYTDQHDRQDRLFTNGYMLGSTATLAANRTQFASVYLPSLVRPTLEEFYTRRGTVVGSAQFRPSDALETNVDVLYSYQRNRGKLPGLNFEIANGAIDPATAVVRDGALVAGSTARLPIIVSDELYPLEQTLLSAGINQRWTSGDWTITGDANHSRARSDSTGQRVQYTTFAPATFDFRSGLNAVPTITVAANLLDPNVTYTGSGTMLFRTVRVRTVVDTARLDVERRFDGPLTRLSAGAAFERRTRSYFRTDRSSTSFGGSTSTANGAGSLLPLDRSDVFRDVDGNFPRNWLIPDRPALFTRYFDFASLDTPQTPADLAASSWLRERTLSGYGMASFAVPVAGLSIEGNAGARLVRTDQFTRGAANPGRGAAAIPIAVSRSYTELLPSLNLKANLTSDLLLRFGYAKTLTRPQPELLAPGLTITLQNGTARGGNPNLRPFVSNNLDLSLEWYFNRSGRVSVAAFDKKFDNYLTQQIAPLCNIPNDFGFNCYNVTTQVNGGAARLSGFEFAYQQTFDFLPGPLSGLGVEAAYTRVNQKSRFAINAAGTATEVVDQLLGVSPASYSLIGFYEKGPISARLGYTWRDEYLVTAGGPGQVRTFFDDFGSLDGTIGYTLNARTSLTVSGANLLRASMRQYGLTPAGIRVPSEHYAYGRTLTAGVQGKF